ncbi:MAG: hypothetical protein QX196_06135 [Methylococcaceae bacterium]
MALLTLVLTDTIACFYLGKTPMPKHKPEYSGKIQPLFPPELFCHE